MDSEAQFFQQARQRVGRRYFFGSAAGGLGAVALASLMGGTGKSAVASNTNDLAASRGGLGLPHFAPRAKRVIFLFQSGGPSQIDLLDYKPGLKPLYGTELPDSVRQGQRLTLMTASQASFRCVGSKFEFKRRGQSGLWMSELLPNIGSVADDLAIVRSVHTEAINHDPAMTLINTGTQQLGKPSLGAWLDYGLGTDNQDLPAYVVMISRGRNSTNQPVFARLWGSGFLPTRHQGVQFRSGSDPVLYLSNPPGITQATRRRLLDGQAEINRLRAQEFGDPEIQTRIAQYELAYRMQSSVPELVDLSQESERTFEMYGPDSRKPGSFAANCLIARRMAERGVRFIQLFHRGWDQHGGLPRQITLQCQDVDQPSAALIKDLKMRGLLDDTLVIWGGEFGRTVYCQGKLENSANYGRDHHGRCFSIWMAGGGIRGGISYGETDDYSYNVVREKLDIRDLNATILHCLGIDHRRFTYPFQGLDERLTGVEDAHPAFGLLA